MARCLRHALDSDIRTLPPLPGRSPRQSRLLTRGLIAWLHVLQPLARARGRLRGILTSPEFELAHEQVDAARPAWHQIADVLSFLAARAAGARASGRSRGWRAKTLLTRIVERLRSTRVATALEIDGAWQRARDVSLQLGRWGRLDVQMLVEEHERGRVLVRIARRLRVTPFFAASVGLAAHARSWRWSAPRTASWVGRRAGRSSLAHDGRARRGTRRRPWRWPTR